MLKKTGQRAVMPFCKLFALVSNTETAQFSVMPQAFPLRHSFLAYMAIGAGVASQMVGCRHSQTLRQPVKVAACTLNRS